MQTYSQAFYHMRQQLLVVYDDREAAAIAHEVMYYITGLDKVQRLMQKDAVLSEEQEERLTAALQELLQGRPLQYITHSAWFLGREFYVDEHVLIPRPETEELVQWVIVEIPNSKFQIPKVLDIGTGSGCIPISLKLAMPDADVTSVDISEDALGVARRNATSLAADVNFVQLDFLNSQEHNKLGVYDVIVSNPPYIPEIEKENMHSNVKDHEPSIALFVPDEDAMLFYKAIARFGKEHLKEGGTIYCEIEVGKPEESRAVFEEMGYKNVEVRKDMHGNWRMVKAAK
jgi:release factor glutamine methyltransferase